MLAKAHEPCGDNDGLMKKDVTPVGIVSFVEGKLNFPGVSSGVMYTDTSMKTFVAVQTQVLINIFGWRSACIYDSTRGAQ